MQINRTITQNLSSASTYERRKLLSFGWYAQRFKEVKFLFTLGSSIKFMAAINLGSENTSIRIGGGPTPLSCTLSPQKGWSPKKGTIVVGHCQKKIQVIKNKTKWYHIYKGFKKVLFLTAAFNPAAVVPAPPWCTYKKCIKKNKNLQC